MADNRNKKDRDSNPFASLFGLGQNNPFSNFLAPFFAAISAIFSGNFGALTNLFSQSDSSPARAGRSLFQRGRDVISDAYDGVSRTVSGVYQRGRNALLELIGKHESGGDYNRVYGPGIKRMPLTDMTINQVLAWQRQYTNNGSASSAAGKYQIIQDTLRGLKREMGLSGNEKFDAAMQDRMAERLVQNRVRESSRNGQVDEARLVRNLSKEWASLPKDGSGLSYYHGDGLNRAHASHASVVRAIDSSFTNDGGVRYASAQRTGKTLDSTPSLSGFVRDLFDGDAPARRTAAAAPAPSTRALLSPSLSLS